MLLSSGSGTRGLSRTSSEVVDVLVMVIAKRFIWRCLDLLNLAFTFLRISLIMTKHEHETPPEP